jgi:hypothetical protein
MAAVWVMTKYADVKVKEMLLRSDGSPAGKHRRSPHSTDDVKHDDMAAADDAEHGAAAHRER